MHSPGKLLGTVSLVQEVISERLEVSQMRIEKCASQSAEVRVFGVVDLSDTPGIDPCSDRLAINLDFFLRTNNGKGKESL